MLAPFYSANQAVFLRTLPARGRRQLRLPDGERLHHPDPRQHGRPPVSTTSINACASAAHRGICCMLDDSAAIYSPASRRVKSIRPSGNGIASSKERDQGRSSDFAIDRARLWQTPWPSPKPLRRLSALAACDGQLRRPNKNISMALPSANWTSKLPHLGTASCLIRRTLGMAHDRANRAAREINRSEPSW